MGGVAKEGGRQYDIFLLLNKAGESCELGRVLGIVTINLVHSLDLALKTFLDYPGHTRLDLIHLCVYKVVNSSVYTSSRQKFADAWVGPVMAG